MDIPAKADVIVIGGGMGGLALARELDLDGRRDVLLLEAGPGDELEHINAANDPETALRLWLEAGADKYFWRPWTAKRAPHYDRTSGLRRRLGGRSLYWHGVILPIEPWALRAPDWPASVVHDLTESWQGGPPLYDLVRADIEAWRRGEPAPAAAPIELAGLTFSVTPQAVRTAAWANGQRWGTYSPLAHWTEGASAGRARVLTGTEVTEVEVEGGRVTGVVVTTESGERTRIGCGTAVLAAGTIESTRLVIQALRSTGRLAEPRLPGLADHLVQGFVAAFDPDAISDEIRAAATADSFYVAPCAASARSNLFLRIYRNGTGAVLFDAWAMGEQRPGETCVVSCVEGERTPWPVFVDADLGPDDTAVIAAQHEQLNTLWRDIASRFGAPADALEFPDFHDPVRMLENLLPGLDNVTPADGVLTWSGPLGSEYHEGCTLPMGSMLDEDQQVVGIPGLYATGPVVFPRAGAANPSLTTLALSKRLARLLADTEVRDV